MRLNLKLKIELCLIKHQINKTSDKNISDSQFGNNYEQRNMNGTKDLLANLQWQTCNGKPAMANLQWQSLNGKTPAGTSFGGVLRILVDIGVVCFLCVCFCG